MSHVSLIGSLKPHQIEYNNRIPSAGSSTGFAISAIHGAADQGDVGGSQPPPANNSGASAASIMKTWNLGSAEKSVLPVQPTSLAFQNVCYFVPNPMVSLAHTGGNISREMQIQEPGKNAFPAGETSHFDTLDPNTATDLQYPSYLDRGGIEEAIVTCHLLQ